MVTSICFFKRSFRIVHGALGAPGSTRAIRGSQSAGLQALESPVASEHLEHVEQLEHLEHLDHWALEHLGHMGHLRQLGLDGSYMGPTMRVGYNNIDFLSPVPPRHHPAKDRDRVVTFT